MTKNEIIQTALIHFAKKGYENTSMDEIAKDLGITKPALYYHFKNKKALYNEIFRHFFSKLEFVDQNDEIQNVKHYINVLGNFFIKNPFVAKLFSKELACEGEHLDEETLKIMSKTIRFLNNSLKENINPFFVQTLIVSAFTTYNNTINLRKKVSKIINTQTDFDIIEEITQTIISYIKAKK